MPTPAPLRPKDPPPSARAGRRRFLLAAASCALIGHAGTSRAVDRDRDAVDVAIERREGEFIVTANAIVAATPAQAWSALSDYDHLADFIPGVSHSRTLERDGADAVIEQRAQARFGPFRQDFAFVLAVHEQVNASIRAEAIGGDFRRFDANYELQPLDAVHSRVRYRATLLPVAAVPPLVGVAVMRGLVRRQFAAMIDEIERRAAG